MTDNSIALLTKLRGDLCLSHIGREGFVFDMTVHSLRRSLARAAAYFEGNTRQWLFDNPKTVVLERHGDAVRFHPRLLDVSSHYCVSLRLCTVRKPNQKGYASHCTSFVGFAASLRRRRFCSEIPLCL